MYHPSKNHSDISQSQVLQLTTVNHRSGEQRPPPELQLPVLHQLRGQSNRPCHQTTHPPLGRLPTLLRTNRQELTTPPQDRLPEERLPHVAPGQETLQQYLDCTPREVLTFPH